MSTDGILMINLTLTCDVSLWEQEDLLQTPPETHLTDT